MKWSAREYVIDIKQKNLEQTAGMMQAKKDAPSVKFSSIGKEDIVHVVDLHLEQDQRGQTQETD